MIVKVDQSGKIEDTRRLTVIAYSNGKKKILVIKAREKRRLLNAMRALDYPKKTFIFKIFAALIFLLIKSSKKLTEIIIDREYPGHEGTIKNIFQNLLRKSKQKKKPKINFKEIGKTSLVHKIAIETFRGKRKADLIIRAEDVLALFY